MLYLMLIYNNDAAMQAAPPEEQAAINAGYAEFNRYMAESGVLRGTATWPSSITTMRSREGRTLTSDGPYAGGSEAVSGFFLIEVESLEEAIEIAERVPSARYGAVEIRPVQA
jgi:Uncharacterized protein conserved in bacteria